MIDKKTATYTAAARLLERMQEDMGLAECLKALRALAGEIDGPVKEMIGGLGQDLRRMIERAAELEDLLLAELHVRDQLERDEEPADL